jgi:hypothetical protein
MEIFNLGC